MVSTRSTSAVTASLHFALYATTGRTTAGASFTCDYNDYFVSGTNSKLGNYAAVDITALPIVTNKTGNDANSLSINPLFNNAGGVVASNYQTNASVSLPGTSIPSIVTDFTTVTSRATTPKMGAYENGFTTQLNSIQTNNQIIIRNSRGIAVPLVGESNIELYTINGLLIEKTKVEGMYARNLQNGIYIICINGKSTKFIK